VTHHSDDSLCVGDLLQDPVQGNVYEYAGRIGDEYVLYRAGTDIDYLFTPDEFVNLVRIARADFMNEADNFLT